jgi:starch-binding outer membrane protein, SusD/RagB family
MKQKIYVALFFLVGLIGCSTDQEIFDTLTTENGLKTQADINAYVSGTYGRFVDFNGIKLGYMTFYLTADDIASRAGAAYGARWSAKTQDAFSSEGVNYWLTLYQVINASNLLLERLPNAKVDSTFRSRTTGEMHFLRAFSYFQLVRLWGDVPIRTQSTAIGQDVAIPRSSVDDVYKQIFADFEEAYKRLPTRTGQASTKFGHATKGAAQALLAKANLTYANHLEWNNKATESPKHYQLAKNWADSVLLSGQYSLIPNFNDLWDVDKEAASYQENIFAIQFTRDGQVANAASVGSEFAVMGLPNTLANVGGSGTAKVGGGNFRAQPWFVERYSTGDYLNDYRSEYSMMTTFTNSSNRVVVTFPKVKASTTSTELTENQPYPAKQRDGKAIDGRNAENDFVITRLADVILIKAEAENELNGPTTVAYTEFNKIRARARNANGTKRTTPLDLATGLTKDQFRAKIIDERAVEFFAEGQRWFDLVRMKGPDGKRMMQYQFETYIPGLPKGLPVFNTATNTWGGGKTDPTTIVPFTQKLLLQPIPFSELSANPKMTQNPGY